MSRGNHTQRPKFMAKPPRVFLHTYDAHLLRLRQAALARPTRSTPPGCAGALHNARDGYDVVHGWAIMETSSILGGE